MNRGKMVKHDVWLLPLLIGAATMVVFLLGCDGEGETLTPPSAVGGQDLPGTPVAPEEIQEARDFKGWPLWWLGESFDSLALTHIDEFTEEQGFTKSEFVSFVYGTCTPPPGGEGCGPPLQIQISPLCSIAPEGLGIAREDLVDLRGAKALWQEESTARIWTGDSTILVGAYPPERLQKALEELVPLGNIQVSLIDSKLPPPNFDSCPGRPRYPASPSPTPTP